MAEVGEADNAFRILKQKSRRSSRRNLGRWCPGPLFVSLSPSSGLLGWAGGPGGGAQPLSPWSFGSGLQSRGGFRGPAASAHGSALGPLRWEATVSATSFFARRPGLPGSSFPPPLPPARAAPGPRDGARLATAERQPPR